MDRPVLIRRKLAFAVDAAFAVLLGAALLVGGDAALAGIPKVLAAMTPRMAAEAEPRPAPSHASVRLQLPPNMGESRYAPQLLYPVPTGSLPEWLRVAVAELRAGPPPALRGVKSAPPPKGPLIAICIDDLGEDIAGTDRAMALPKDVALAFLPYAEATPFLAEAAARKGHLILAHLPMAAIGPADPGPMALRPDMRPEEIIRRLSWAIARVPGLSGVNNHEGSRFTADAGALAPVMRVLKQHGLFFLDSRTTPRSQGMAVAAAMGVEAVARDVFLDDDPSEAAVKAQLALLAATAKRQGVAVAIGHPRDVTLTQLSRWLAKDHSVTLVPLDQAMRVRIMALAGR